MPDQQVEITVDADRCVGSSTCIGIAPARFHMGADGVAEPIHEEPVVSDEALLEAEDSCPVQAIQLRAP